MTDGTNRVVVAIDAEIARLLQARVVLTGVTYTHIPEAPLAKKPLGRPKGSGVKAVSTAAPKSASRPALSLEVRKKMGDAMRRRWAEAKAAGKGLGPSAKKAAKKAAKKTAKAK